MLFEIHGLILGLALRSRFLKNPGSIARANAGFDNILKCTARPDGAAGLNNRPSNPVPTTAKE